MVKRFTLEKITGFTLAEVLITLTVIGVIAALTIPSLITNIQDAQYKTAWKKDFSDFNQATTRLKMDNGGSLMGVFANNDDMRDKYLQYMSYVKACPVSSNAGNCWHLDGNWKVLDGSSATGAGSKSGGILNNGSLLMFSFANQSCADANFGLSKCGIIEVDVNGWKGPNTYGKDIFGLYVLPDKVIARGYSDSYVGTCISTSCGIGCSADYLKR